MANLQFQQQNVNRVWRQFFFFQAEDGIRDLYVTGVQTCALPISPRRTSRAIASLPDSSASSRRSLANHCRILAFARGDRSEERRVGKSVDLGGRRIIRT